MLFNSPEFLLIFLPVTLVGFLLVRSWSPQLTILWLLAASLAFYGSWQPSLLVLLMVSMTLNYCIGRQVESQGMAGRRWLMVGIAGNLMVLFFFKYANFVIGSVNLAFSAGIPGQDIVLPIAISFFTFQQIAYLVDVHRGVPRAPSMAHYMVFVAVFPHLIAGPLTHHREMIPQFGQKATDSWGDFAQGVTLFTIGLLKKLLVADTMARPADVVFDGAALGLAPTFVDAWMAAICYTVQIYFDFSGYSDMALGLGRMFGLRLPINFASPYRARSIIEFWRRWHITLSRFLRDYLYIALGGNRRGPARQRINLLVTMLLGGLWHGANWTFVVWGAMHGVFLLLNHMWRASPIYRLIGATPAWRVIAPVITLLCVIGAWVPFRAADLGTALAVWRGMLGLNGVIVPVQLASFVPAGLATGPVAGFSILTTAFAVLALGGAALVPNIYQVMARVSPGLPSAGYPETEIAVGRAALWETRPVFAVLVGIGLAAALLKLNDISAFIYFQF